jgi:hypothetical protein
MLSSAHASNFIGFVIGSIVQHAPWRERRTLGVETAARADAACPSRTKAFVSATQLRVEPEGSAFCRGAHHQHYFTVLLNLVSGIPFIAVRILPRPAVEWLAATERIDCAAPNFVSVVLETRLDRLAAAPA